MLGRSKGLIQRWLELLRDVIAVGMVEERRKQQGPIRTRLAVALASGLGLGTSRDAHGPIHRLCLSFESALRDTHGQKRRVCVSPGGSQTMPTTCQARSRGHTPGAKALELAVG